jgi:hypothetical protein
MLSLPTKKQKTTDCCVVDGEMMGVYFLLCLFSILSFVCK